ncbi:hypothetical protein [Algoriphagus limi]|uniref:Uncharacterized protein n=1 Tax=Algoriphagus limi TaxID=2975273 RepID=A0ABT2G8X3_9BACT|nr:hypothetical protein [Algoriphagus limi]MCS5491728.1 hypothetical protein [Algoriphagus limi]
MNHSIAFKTKTGSNLSITSRSTIQQPKLLNCAKLQFVAPSVKQQETFNLKLLRRVFPTEHHVVFLRLPVSALFRKTLPFTPEAQENLSIFEWVDLMTLLR